MVLVRRRVDYGKGLGAYRAWVFSRVQGGGLVVSQEDFVLAVRFTLEQLSLAIPGNSVEVRVPFYGAVQCFLGVDHKRGTASNVFEMDAFVWLRLVSREVSWQSLVEQGDIFVSGFSGDLERIVAVFDRFLE